MCFKVYLIIIILCKYHLWCPPNRTWVWTSEDTFWKLVFSFPYGFCGWNSSYQICMASNFTKWTISSVLKLYIFIGLSHLTVNICLDVRVQNKKYVNKNMENFMFIYLNNTVIKIGLSYAIFYYSFRLLFKLELNYDWYSTFKSNIVFELFYCSFR